MTETKNQAKVDKQPYSTPQLVRHGSVEELTRASALPAVLVDGVSIVI
ncbi:MAG TPA: lasso RiPP family leader peptide-containing protein [Thermoanaerobaculia bacterium]